MMIPAIERQDSKVQQVAHEFIAFFEGKIDLPTLKIRLTKYDEY